MKESSSQVYLNKKLYYGVILSIILLMLLGLILDNPSMMGDGEFHIGYFFHNIFFLLLSTSLLIYPKYSTHLHRKILITFAFIFCYLIFFLYPDTWSTFIFLCLLPSFSILFFDEKLFYASLIINTILIILTFCYIVFVDKGNFYHYINRDLIGNFFNFLASQVIIYFIYFLSNNRIKQQRLYYEEIKQAERLKTTGQLAAAVAHEVRNPLTVVKGFLQLYEQDPTLDQDKKKHFELLVNELDTAEHVITQFLSISKPSKENKTEIVNIRDTLKSVKDILYSYGLLNDNSIEVYVEDDYYVALNKIELKQILVNIVKNAIEASNVGDSVVIEAEQEKEYVKIRVKDNGQGMSEKELQYLGTPFYSLKSKGTGLGMMICFNIAAKYKGKIDVASTKGQGTTVTISFPAVRQ